MDLTADGRVAIPGGLVLRGVVSSVEPATRTNRTAKMTVTFDQVTVNGRDYPLRGTVTQALEGEGIKGDIGKAVLVRQSVASLAPCSVAARARCSAS